MSLWRRLWRAFFPRNYVCCEKCGEPCPEVTSNWDIFNYLGKKCPGCGVHLLSQRPVSWRGKPWPPIEPPERKGPLIEKQIEPPRPWPRSNQWGARAFDA